MASGEVFPVINCSDLAGTKSFYQRVFAAQQSYEFVHEGEEVYVTLDVGEGKIALGRGTSPAMYGETPLPAAGHAIDLCLYVLDLDASVEAAPKVGGRIVVDPHVAPWGERVAYLQDPEGNMLLTIQIEVGG